MRGDRYNGRPIEAPSGRCIAYSGVSLIMLGVVLAVPVVTNAVGASNDQFADRRDRILLSLSGQRPSIAEIRPPLSEGRGLFSRHYSYSVVNFALRSLWLDEFVEEANALLAENSRFYIEHELERNEHHSFYWAADMLCRLVEYFGASGSIASGRLNGETESEIHRMMFKYCMDNSIAENADYQSNHTWHLPVRENHHAQRFMTVWHFLQILAETGEYMDRTLSDGREVTAHLEMWNAFFREYLRERLRKGLFVEAASKEYNVKSLKGIYNAYDFAEDPEIRYLAGAVLDLYWASWAEEQIDGVRGGAKSRVYQGPMSLSSFRDGIGRWGKFYLGHELDSPPELNDFTMLLSDYRMPPVVLDIAKDIRGRGEYTVRTRVPAVAVPGHHTPPDHRVLADEGGMVRQAYCTPDFVMGTFLMEARPYAYWSMLNSECRWQGVVFAGHPDARIVPDCRPVGVDPQIGGHLTNLTFNQMWSVQSQGTLITRKLPGALDAGEVRVWFSEAGLSAPVHREGWIITESKGAYAGVRATQGSYRWKHSVETEDSGVAKGYWMLCDDEWTAVIIEVSRKSNWTSFDAFEAALLETTVINDSGDVHYKSLSGDQLVLPSDQPDVPKVNGQAVLLSPERVFDSPFVRSDWNSGRVVIRKDDRTHTIDINPQRRN